MIFDVNGASGPLLKIHREIVGSRPIHEGSSALVGVHRAIFELFSDGKLVETIDCGTDELGLGDGDTPPDDLVVYDVAFPQHVGDAIRRFLSTYPNNAILWLWLSEPFGYLPVLPYDAMLAKVIPTHPIVRLSCDNVTAANFKEAQDSVVCFSCPGTDPSEAVERWLAIIPPAELLKGYRIHVFADPRSRKLLRNRVAAFELHEPPSSLAELIEEESTSAISPNDVRHPWLAWILETLEHHAVDFVHIVCHGLLATHQGALLFAEPVLVSDNRTARPLYAGEVDRFLDRLGAWSFSISSPPGNPSISGLRYFEEQLAQMRYGPVVLQDLTADPDGSQLLESLRYYVSKNDIKPSSSVSRYWNPNRSLAHQSTQIGGVQLEPPISEALKTEPDAAVTMQRVFESALARYQRAPEENETQQAIRSGIGDALTFMHKIVTETENAASRSEPSETEQ